MRKINPICAAILLTPFAFAVALFVLAMISDRSALPRSDPGFTSSIKR